MARRSTRSATRPRDATDGRWVELLPNWASALGALLSAAAAVIGVVVINQPPDEPDRRAPRATLASLTTDASGVDAQGAYEGLVPQEHDVVLMMRPASADDTWLVIEASRKPTKAGAEPEDGVWSASAPVAGDHGWLATVAVIPAVPAGVTGGELRRELRENGPGAPSVIHADEVQSVG